MVYLDSSAILKLVVPEPESSALGRYLATEPERVSSALARVEVVRAARRRSAAPETRRRADEVLASIALVAVTRDLLASASVVGPRTLGSLDAIHLATARSLVGLRSVVTYDSRLREAAEGAGLAVDAPGRRAANAGHAADTD